MKRPAQSKKHDGHEIRARVDDTLHAYIMAECAEHERVPTQQVRYMLREYMNGLLEREALPSTVGAVDHHTLPEPLGSNTIDVETGNEVVLGVPCRCEREGLVYHVTGCPKIGR